MFVDLKITPVMKEGVNRQMEAYAEGLAMTRTYSLRPEAPQGLALSRFFNRADYWERTYRGPSLVHPVRNPNHWNGPRASA